jgi:hypothetical protein
MMSIYSDVKPVINDENEAANERFGPDFLRIANHRPAMCTEAQKWVAAVNVGMEFGTHPWQALYDAAIDIDSETVIDPILPPDPDDLPAVEAEGRRRYRERCEREWKMLVRP